MSSATYMQRVMDARNLSSWNTCSKLIPLAIYTLIFFTSQPILAFALQVPVRGVRTCIVFFGFKQGLHVGFYL